MDGKEILTGIRAVSKSLWISKERILIVADLHIGYEEALNKKGVLVPRRQFLEIKKEISELIEKLGPETIIINGDLKHEFGEISRQEWADTSELLDLMLKTSKVILVKGNHDKILGPIARKKGLEIKDVYCIGKNKEICIFHGDKMPIDAEMHNSKILIIAHEHPSITLNEDKKTEKYKCFLLGKWKGKKVIEMPSFLPFIEGFDIRNEERMTRLLKEKIDDFEVFIIGDEIYDFGKLKNI
jgi:putative SbcD/Mre11-related phosphoesterase